MAFSLSVALSWGYEADYRSTLKGIAKHFPDFKDYPHLAQLAMLNWLWQIGPHAPAKFPRATEAIRNRDWARAADEWEYANTRTRRHSDWYNQTPHRCRQESQRLRIAAQQEDNR